MEAFLKKLFSSYYKDVYSYLYSLTHNALLSEDLASEVFLEVVKSISSFRGEADIKTWIFSIARHKWFAYLRKEKREVKTETLIEFYDERNQSIEGNYLHHVVAERIYQLLEAEPKRTRDIVLMRIEGYSFYEIGRKYHISENSARVIDFRAKAKIRKILKEEGYENE